MTATYLLTWKPKRFSWPTLSEDASAVARGEKRGIRWSCGNRKSIEEGSRFFMLRQGHPPRGIVASGWVTRASFRDLHWEPARAKRGDQANFVRVVFDALLDESSKPLPVEELDDPDLSLVDWQPQSSGILLPEEAAAQLELRWAKFHGLDIEGELSDPLTVSAVEGRIQVRLIRHRSRERALRAAKIREALSKGRLVCEVPGCGFDFEDRYGHIGSGFAHVHHLVPLADLEAPTRIDLGDLAVVCANCHAMVHRGGECRSLETLIR